MRLAPERYFDEKLAATDFLTEDRAVDGTDVQESFFADGFGGQQAPKPTAPEDIVVTLECSLEELYNGSIKSLEYVRDVVKHDAKTTQKETTTQQVEVKAGSSEESQLVFRKMGNQAAGQVHANLIVKFKQTPHAEYRRVGHDLILTKKITLVEAFENNPTLIQTLDGRRLSVAVDEQVSP